MEILNILDTNVVQENIKHNLYEKGFILDVTLFEMLKCEPKYMFKNFIDLKKYLKQSESPYLLMKANEKNPFEERFPNRYGFKLAMKTAKKVGNYLGTKYIEFCILIFVCYALRKNGININEKGEGIESKDSNVSNVCNALIHGLPQIISLIRNKIGKDIIANPDEFKKSKFDVKYFNLIIDYYNQKSIDKYKFNHIEHLNHGVLSDNNSIKYTDTFLLNFVNLINFKENPKETKKVYYALLKGVFTQKNFMFSHIADLCFVFTALKNNLKVKTFDSIMKNKIFYNLNVFTQAQPYN